MNMKIKYDYNQNNQIIIKNDLNSEIDTSIIDTSKGKKKNIDKIIKILYLKEGDKVKIFGEDFSKNNRNKYKIIYKNKKCKSKTFIENKEKTKNIEIKLQIFEDISNLDSMFEGCINLKDSKEISKLRTQKVKSMKKLFFQCSSLEFLPILSNFDLTNVTNIKGMFYGCSNITSIPDISNWNTSKIKDMSYLFYGCSQLIGMPDISNWNTSNINNISYLFYRCS